jgi:hypothetical protein
VFQVIGVWLISMVAYMDITCNVTPYKLFSRLSTLLGDWRRKYPETDKHLKVSCQVLVQASDSVMNCLFMCNKTKMKGRETKN